MNNDLSIRGSLKKIPFRPRFLLELVVIPIETGVLFYGGVEPRLIRTSGNNSSFLHLLHLLDGTRTITDIVSMLPTVPLQHTLDVLSLMNTLGLLEEGREVGESHILSETEAYLSRFTYILQRHKSGHLAFEQLKKTQIILVESHRSDDGLRFLSGVLVEMGITCSSCSIDDLDAAVRLPLMAPKLVVAFSGCGIDKLFHSRVDELCRKHNSPWLRLAMNITLDFSDIGPLFGPGSEACYKCFSNIYEITASFCEMPRKLDTASLMALAATHIVHHITGLTRSKIGRGFLRYALSPTEFLSLPTPRFPECLQCGARDTHAGRGAFAKTASDVSVVYEQVVRGTMVPGSSKTASKENVDPFSQLSREFKNFPNSATISLPRGQHLSTCVSPNYSENERNTKFSVDLEMLSEICELSVGIRCIGDGKMKVQRWTPSAGNFGSVELYLIIRDAEDVIPGVYFYEPQNHSLARLEHRQDILAIDEVIARSVRLQDDTKPAVLMVLTGAYHRLTVKYGTFGYRLVNFDSGVAATVIKTTAKELGITAEHVPIWADDFLENQLNLNHLQEQVTCVVALFEKDKPLRRSVTLSDVKMDKRSKRDLVWYAGTPLSNLMKSSFESSRVLEAELGVQSNVGLFTDAKASENSFTQNGPLRGLLLKRISVRQFKNIELELRYVEAMMNAVVELQYNESLAHFMQLQILSLRVKGLRRGLYTCSYPNAQLNAPFKSVTSRVLHKLFTQSDIISAPVIFLISADILAVTDKYGSYGHRLLMLEAGKLSQHLWITALRLGFSGVITAGISAVVVRKELQLNEFREAPMLAFAMGAAA